VKSVPHPAFLATLGRHLMPYASANAELCHNGGFAVDSSWTQWTNAMD